MKSLENKHLTKDKIEGTLATLAPTPSGAVGRRRLPRPEMKYSEADVRARCLSRLSKHFHISEEVEGTHVLGGRVRIDAILRPKDPERWKNPHVSLGLEFKGRSKYHEVGNITKALAQCMDYANTRWDGFGLTYVFICPSLIDASGQATGVDQRFLRRLLARMGVGELAYNPRWGIWLNLADDRLWSEKEGVKTARFNNLKRSFGSR